MNNCIACKIAGKYNLSEWDTNTIHDLHASRVAEILLERVAKGLVR